MSQAYMNNFTVGIQLELKAFKNITVQLVSPLFVNTKLIGSTKPITQYMGKLIPTAETYAKSAVWTIGKTAETTGYWSHGLQVAKMHLFILPEPFKTDILVLSAHLLEALSPLVPRVLLLLRRMGHPPVRFCVDTNMIVSKTT